MSLLAKIQTRFLEERFFLGTSLKSYKIVKIVFRRSKGRPAVDFPKEVAFYDNNIKVFHNVYPYSVDDETDPFHLAQIPDIGELELQPASKETRQAPSSLSSAKADITDLNVTRSTRPEDVATPSIEQSVQTKGTEEPVKATDAQQDEASNRSKVGDIAENDNTVHIPELRPGTHPTAPTGNTSSAQPSNALYARHLPPPINRTATSQSSADRKLTAHGSTAAALTNERSTSDPSLGDTADRHTEQEQEVRARDPAISLASGNGAA
ncbi:hypothetical protein LTR95_017051 [Oleoguttula sp. CCFEE 5521]